MKAPLPHDESRRLDALRQYAILDTAPELAFDDLTLLAAEICQTPIALISIVAEARQWFKSRVGLDAAETHRDLAFCAHAILHKDQILEVGDALADLRFADNALVLADPNIRFYAGTPLVVHDGQPLGTLCVIDRVPRVLSERQRLALQALGRHVAALIEGRQMNQQLRLARDQARRADWLKSAFLATMSHELRTPLNSIIGFTGIILQGLAGPLNSEQSKQLGMVRSSARHLLALINDVLDISKIEAGELQVDHAPVDLRASIDKAIGIVAPLAEGKGLILRSDLSALIDESFGVVMADARRVDQVLLNLLNNAIKFTERGEVVLLLARQPQTVTISIRDSGIGIKPDDMVHLFQPFRQLDDGLARQHEGTGLGLAICRRLAELMGGTVHAESMWGEGSVFTFTLPLTEGAAT